MRILFLENRYSTWLWQHGAQALEAEGAEVSWLVQNHGFKPSASRIHIIPYPRKSDFDGTPLSPTLEAIARTDRGLTHFGIHPSHYRHYDKHIQDTLEEVMPDVVFGEATQFHELMTINHCKARGIPYLAPNATRYPPGRLTFFLHDTFEVFGGEDATPPDNELRQQLDDIVHRRVIPSYMEPPLDSRWAYWRSLSQQLHTLLNWILGERYITPAPWTKLSLNRRQRKARAHWDSLAVDRGGKGHIPQHARWVLYPLQLQPESNLDVFGQPWVDQCATMTQAALSLRRIGAMLVVKPNPKSKYEMSERLVAAAAAHDNIIVIPHDFPMSDLFRRAPLVLSATGTVILESIFQSKPVAVLGKHSLTRLPGVTPIDSPAQIANILQQVTEGVARTATAQEALSVFRELYSSSYDALLWDPVSRPDLLSNPDAVLRLRRAFTAVVSQLRAETP